MTAYTYTGRLADLGDAPFPGAQPRLWVEPVENALPFSGLVSESAVHATKRVPISVASNGSFSVDLVASADLIPQSRYRLRVDWLDGGSLLGWTDWIFTARIGGGRIFDMTEGDPTNVWYSTSPPPVNRAGIYWINPDTGDVREWM